MSRIKADLSRLSLNQLCTLTGKTSRTLKKLLADVEPEEESGTFYYRPPEALPAIYGISHSGLSALAAPDPDEDDAGDDSSDRKLDPIREKALLDRARRMKVELEIQEQKKLLIRAESVEAEWARMAGAFRSRILNIPKKLAAKLCQAKEIRAIEKILTTECHEALTELSAYGADFSRADADPQGS